MWHHTLLQHVLPFSVCRQHLWHDKNSYTQPFFHILCAFHKKGGVNQKYSNEKLRISMTEHSQRKGVKPKLRGCKLRSSIYWQEALNKRAWNKQVQYEALMFQDCWTLMYGQHLQDKKQINHAIIKYHELCTCITNVENAFNDTRTKLNIHAHVYQIHSGRTHHCSITITSNTQEKPLSINRSVLFQI